MWQDKYEIQVIELEDNTLTRALILQTSNLDTPQYCVIDAVFSYKMYLEMIYLYSCNLTIFNNNENKPNFVPAGQL